MQPIDQASFIAAMRRARLAADDEPARLTFGRYEETDRFWVWPWPPQNIVGLLSTILHYVAPTGYWDAWAPGGVWHEEEASYLDSIRLQLVAGLGIPTQHRGALRFLQTEISGLLALALAYAIAGWSVNEDLCIVPEAPHFLVRLSHHGVVHVECDSVDRVAPLVTRLQAAGWKLPTDVPDGTFKVPVWMAVRVPEAPT